MRIKGDAINHTRFFDVESSIRIDRRISVKSQIRETRAQWIQ